MFFSPSRRRTRRLCRVELRNLKQNIMHPTVNGEEHTSVLLNNKEINFPVHVILFINAAVVAAVGCLQQFVPRLNIVHKSHEISVGFESSAHKNRVVGSPPRRLNDSIN